MMTSSEEQQSTTNVDVSSIGGQSKLTGMNHHNVLQSIGCKSNENPHETNGGDALTNAKPSLVSLFSTSSSGSCACQSELLSTESDLTSKSIATNTRTTLSETTSAGKEVKVLSSSSIIYNMLNNELDEIDIFEAIADIRDPEHPYSLEELNIITEDSVSIIDRGLVKICFTPTVKHCSLVSHISLCIRERLKRRFGKSTFQQRYKLEIYVTEGSHNEEEQVNKQMNDKERVTAALENPLILELVRQCIGECD